MKCPSISLVKRLDASSASDITEQVERFWTISCRVSARGRKLHPSTASATLQSTLSALIAVRVMTLCSTQGEASRHYCRNRITVIFKSLWSIFLILAISFFFSLHLNRNENIWWVSWEDSDPKAICFFYGFGLLFLKCNFQTFIEFYKWINV